MLTCAECAWTRVLMEMNQGCIDIDAIAFAEYQPCIDTPASSCTSDCMDEVNDLWGCAKPIYCSSSIGSFEEVDCDFVDDGLCHDDELYCFSLESNVVVKGKGLVSITDLAIGDMVLSDDKGTYTYSMYYSKNHFSEDIPTPFFRIFTETFTKKPLELTKDHLVYRATQDLSVPAHSIKVGDVLKTLDGPSKVTFIQKIKRNGSLPRLL